MRAMSGGRSPKPVDLVGAAQAAKLSFEKSGYSFAACALPRTRLQSQGERHVIVPSVPAYFEGVLAAMHGGAVEVRDGKGVAWTG